MTPADGRVVDLDSAVDLARDGVTADAGGEPELRGGFAALVVGARLALERWVAMLVAILVTAMLVLPMAAAASVEARLVASTLVPLVLVAVLLSPAASTGVHATIHVLLAAFVPAVLFTYGALLALPLLLPLAALPTLRWQLGSWRASMDRAWALLRRRWRTTVLAGFVLAWAGALLLVLPAWMLLAPLVDDRLAVAAASSLSSFIIGIAGAGWARIAVGPGAG